MPLQDMLVLAVYQTVRGLGFAGMTTESDPVTGLRWVRPVRERGIVLLDDITTSGGTILRPFDVLGLDLLCPLPTSPHPENWIADFVDHRPRVVRRLENRRRVPFLGKHLDTAPRQVLDTQHRSICLCKPDWVKGAFRLDGSSGRLDARLAFGLDRRAYQGSYAKGGLPITDLKWRALGRAWLPENGGWTSFTAGDLEARFGIREIYLVIGLTHTYSSGYKLVVVGIHTFPDYAATVDYDNL
jgi:hypothetical protein